MSSRAFQAMSPLVLSNVGVCWSLKSWERERSFWLTIRSGRSFQPADHTDLFPLKNVCLVIIAVSHRRLPPPLRLTRLSAILCHSLLPSAAQTREIKHGQRSAPSSQRHRHKSKRDLRLEFYTQLHNLCKGQSQVCERAWKTCMRTMCETA
jgi:hypothetical protein